MNFKLFKSKASENSFIHMMFHVISLVLMALIVLWLWQFDKHYGVVAASASALSIYCYIIGYDEGKDVFDNGGSVKKGIMLVLKVWTWILLSGLLYYQCEH